MNERLLSVVAAVVVVLGLAATSSAAAANLEQRWFYLATNFLVDKNVDNALKLLDRAAAAGYNGVVVADSKFMRWDDLPKKYLENVRRVREACRQHKITFIACVCSIGYSNDLLSRDPNLAEGIPVVNAPFVARGGKLVPEDDSIRLANGGFEQGKKNMPAGWAFVDMPGKISFLDTQVKCQGRQSLRMENIGANDPKNGHGRACQTLTVKPFHYYHVSAMVKTEKFEAAQKVRIGVIGSNGATLNFAEPTIAKTQDWRRIDVAFNSLECTKVNLYLGVWGGRGGKIWWDDVRIEPAGFVNVIRRAGTPLSAVGADDTTYQEGRDFSEVRDLKLGKTPYSGEFTVWHQPPTITLPPGSRIREGQTVLFSYYHIAIIYWGQVMCCMAEPKLYDILRWQIREVHKNIEPDGYFMQHDEIRSQGWDESCLHTHLTPGQLLAENVKKCQAIIRTEDPGKPIYVWSDMFDPFHNAQKTGRYYLVKGDGPWYGSWAGLDKDTIVVNWNSQPGKRRPSLEHFAALGNRQILAGYYDGPVPRITEWLHDAQNIPGVTGVMYTTWRSSYDDLEKFSAELSKSEK